MATSPTRQLAAVHRALAHPVRLRVLAMLQDGELCVCQLTAVLKLAVSTVSAHVAALRRAGLVHERKSGRWVYSQVAGDAWVRRLVAPVWAALRGDPLVEHDRAIVRQLRRLGPERLCGAGLDLRRAGVRGAAVRVAGVPVAGRPAAAHRRSTAPTRRRRRKGAAP